MNRTLRRLCLDALGPDPAIDLLPETALGGISCDSRRVEPGDLFIAVRGARQDGAQYLLQALERGAAAVVGEPSARPPEGVPFLSVEDSRHAASRLAAAFHGFPSARLKTVGITGTNGKTTVSFLVEHLLRTHGRRPGVLGTVSYRYDGYEEPARETTPGPLDVQRILARMVEAGCDWSVLEASSHALDQKRVEAVEFEAGVFTNLTQDHLDYHRTMDAYFRAKARLFESLSPQRLAVINTDDTCAGRLCALTRAKVLTYGIDAQADFRAADVRLGVDGTSFGLVHEGRTSPVRSPLVGRHNTYNALAALATLTGLGFDLESSIRALERFAGVPGRLESVDEGQDFRVFVDYAHTPDGLLNVLKCLRESAPKRLLVVFGCGGDRDRGKRPQMGRIAAEWADLVYITSDNPRTEDPGVIAAEVRDGVPPGREGVRTVLDRARAIRQALLEARAGDVVLLAGKGHEKVQVIGERAIAFSDRLEAEKVLRGR